MNNTMSTSGSFAVVGSSQTLPAQPPKSLFNLSALVEHAIAQNVSAEVLERVIAYTERQERLQARRAFDEAMAGFHGDPDLKRIVKSTFGPDLGGKGKAYKYATLDDMLEAISPVAAKYGLHTRWSVHTGENEILVTTHVSHVGGHAIENSVGGPRETSGAKNPWQAIGSAITYAQKYGLLPAYGLAAALDDDANSFPRQGEKAPLTITEQQANALLEHMHKTGIDEQVVYTALGVKNVTEIKASEYADAVKRVDEWKKKKDAKARAAKKEAK